jgi:hypothetical protein
MDLHDLWIMQSMEIDDRTKEDDWNNDKKLRGQHNFEVRGKNRGKMNQTITHKCGYGGHFPLGRHLRRAYHKVVRTQWRSAISHHQVWCPSDLTKQLAAGKYIGARRVGLIYRHPPNKMGKWH